MTKFWKSIRHGHFSMFEYMSISGKAKYSDNIASVMRRGLLWGGLAAGFIGLLFGFDLIGDMLEECVTVVFEFIQESLETLYRKQFKLELYQAQMATAYTVFVIFMGAGYFLVRKMSIVLRNALVSWRVEREKARDLCMKQWNNLMCWWESMDGFNKCFALIGLVVVAVPLVSIVCIALGKLVAELV